MGKLTISKTAMWLRIVDYYYDEVHWDVSPDKSPIGLFDWLENEYRAYTGPGTNNITFDSRADYEWFMLRWA